MDSDGYYTSTSLSASHSFNRKKFRSCRREKKDENSSRANLFQMLSTSAASLYASPFKYFALFDPLCDDSINWFWLVFPLTGQALVGSICKSIIFFITPVSLRGAGLLRSSLKTTVAEP